MSVIDVYRIIGYCRGYLVVTKWRYRRKLKRLKRKLAGVRNYLWYKVELRGNEFDSSLGLDPAKMEGMNRAELKRYCEDVGRKRDIAHELDLKGK